MPTDRLKDSIPVFCTADIPLALLNEFFVTSQSVPELCELSGLGVLIDTENVSRITTYTVTPIFEASVLPFLGFRAHDVIQWAESHLDRWEHGITPFELVILDERTVEDRTCLLVTVREGEHARKEGACERLMVRSDFRSSLVTLNVKVQACGGDGHFERLAPDGVLRHYD